MKILRNFCDGCVHKMVCKYREETENLNANIVDINCTYRVDIPGWNDVHKDDKDDVMNYIKFRLSHNNSK